MLSCVRRRGVTTYDTEKTAGVVHDHRKDMAQVPVVLPMPEARVYEALRDVSQHNKTVLGLSGDSAAARTALQPDCFWSVNQIRREVDVGYDSWQLSNQNRGSGTEVQYRGVQRKYPAACVELNALITDEEVAAVLGKLKDVGAGPDGMPPVVLRDHANHTSCPVIQSFVRDFNVVFATEIVPTTWQQYRLLLHHKGHNAHPEDCDSYRGLGIGDGSLKIMSMVLEERLSKFLISTNALSSEQMGFKRESGTIEATVTLSEVIRNASKTKPVFTAFIDVQAAYDSVIREVLYEKMLRMGIGGNFLTTIQGFYHSMCADLEVGKFNVGSVNMEIGLAQGSPLSPLLFNVYLDDSIRGLKERAYEKSQQDGSVYGLPLPSAPNELQTGTIVSQFFADDGTLMEHSMPKLQWLADTMVELLRNDGLVVNVPKTKVMVTVAQNRSDEQAELDQAEFSRDPLMIYDKPVEFVLTFPYLGTMLNSRGN